MQVRKQQLELDMEQQTDSKSGKEYVKAVYCHPAYQTYVQSTSWETLGWMKHKLESVCQEKYQYPQIRRWHHPYVRKWRRTKEPLDESERGEWKSWLKTHCMGWVSVENIINCCIPCCQNQRQLPTKTLIIISSQSWLSCRLTSKIPRNFAIIPVSLWFSVQQWDLSKLPTLMILHKYFWSLWWKSYKSK